MTFDRLWSVYLENKLKIKRNKKTVTILILIVITFVFAIDQIYLAYYVQNFNYPILVFNQTLNKSVIVIIIVGICNQKNQQISQAQDMIFVIMRIILPFIIMAICNSILINHIRQSRKRVIRGRNERKNHSFTLSVAIMNGSFLIFNIGVTVYYIIFYYNYYSRNSFGNVGNTILSFYGNCSIILSYFFILCQFLVDMIFNKIFRKEIIITFLIITGRRNQVEQTRGGVTQTNNTN